MMREMVHVHIIMELLKATLIITIISTILFTICRHQRGKKGMKVKGVVTVKYRENWMVEIIH